MAKTHWVTTSGVGVITAATMKLTKTAYLRLWARNCGVTIPSFARRRIKTGSSNTRPIPRMSRLILGMGLVFELPVLILLLAKLGIVTPQFLAHNLKYAVLVSFIVAAVITPTPDVVTQCVFAIPMIALYVVGLGASLLVRGRRGDG